MIAKLCFLFARVRRARAEAREIARLTALSTRELAALGLTRAALRRHVRQRHARRA